MTDFSETQNKQKLNRCPRCIAYNSGKPAFLCCAGVWWCPPQWFTSLYFTVLLVYLAFSSEKKANTTDLYYISTPARISGALVLTGSWEPIKMSCPVLLRLKANLHGCWISWSLFNKQTKKKLICRNMTASSLKLMADVLRPPWQQNFIWVKRKKKHPLNEVLLWLLYLSKNEPWSYILVLHSSKKKWVCTTWT